MNDATPLIPAIGSLLGILFLFLGLRANRKKRLLQNLPTAKTKGVFIGLVELKGSAESSEPFTSFLAESRCVQFSWKVEEHWSRTVRESYTDSKGRSKTRTRRESGWKTVASGGEEQPFYLEDDAGAVLVRPTGAKLEPLTIFSEHCTRSDGLYYGKGPDISVSNSDHRRKFTEIGFPIHTPIYVVGQAREREDIVAPEIAQDAAAPMFLISTKSEEQVTGKYATAAFLWSFFGLIFCVAGLIWFDSLRHQSPDQRIPIYLGVGVGYLMIWGIGWIWTVFNSLIDLRNRVRQAWSLVDVQLKRRHDLIPNLVTAVSGLKDYEAQAQQELAELRTQSTATAPGESGSDIHA
ncbi:MAG: GIDE domain-containing protein, partial [Verrucomicrobiia bacterium]